MSPVDETPVGVPRRDGKAVPSAYPPWMQLAQVIPGCPALAELDAACALRARAIQLSRREAVGRATVGIRERGMSLAFDPR